MLISPWTARRQDIESVTIGLNAVQLSTTDVMQAQLSRALIHGLALAVSRLVPPDRSPTLLCALLLLSAVGVWSRAAMASRLCRGSRQAVPLGCMIVSRRADPLGCAARGYGVHYHCHLDRSDCAWSVVVQLS